MQQLSTIDVILVALYLVAMVAIGIYSMRKRENVDDYYVGGRRAGIFIMGCLWMSSWIGGATVIGSTDQAYTVGIAGLWYCGAMLIGCLLFAFTSTSLIQTVGAKFNFLTYPELIEKRFGTTTRVIATITTFLAYIAYSSGQFLAMGKLLNAFLGWDLSSAIWLSAASMVIYTALGGFIAVTITGVAQALIIMVTLAFVMVPIVWWNVADISLTNTLPEGFFDIGAWGWSKALGLTVTIVFTFYTSMDSYTRCFASKNARAAKWGTALAAGMIAVIAFTTTFLGMSGKALMPDMPEGMTIMSALILNYMPDGVKGLILIGLLAAIMSTGAVCILVATANVTQDIYKRFIRPEATEKNILLLGTVVSVGVGILATYMAIYKQDIVNVLYIAFTINSASLFIPTMVAFTSRKGGATAAAWSMGLSLAVVLIWYIGQEKAPDNWWFGFDPVWPGLIVSGVVFFVAAKLFPLTEMDKKKIADFWG